MPSTVPRETVIEDLSLKVTATPAAGRAAARIWRDRRSLTATALAALLFQPLCPFMLPGSMLTDMLSGTVNAQEPATGAGQDPQADPCRRTDSPAGADASGNRTDERRGAGDQAGDPAGDHAGQQAGDTAGDPAGGHAGAPAGGHAGQQAGDTEGADPAADHREDDAPALGVLVGSCPGRAVCVKGTLPNSPADEAGIEPGDYILSVDGKEVRSPRALKRVLSGLRPEEQVTLKIWREGEEREAKVQLASKADQLPKMHDAWLGVMLSPSEQEGVTIDHIIPGSPAAQSELQEGDMLVKMQGKNLKDVKEFMQNMEELGPGDELELTVRRGGEERIVSLRVGRIGDAPMAFLRHLQSMRSAPFASGGQPGESDSGLEFIDRALDDLREQVRALQKEVRELRGGEDRARPQVPQPEEGDSSQRAGRSDGRVKLVSQIQLQLPQGRVYNQRGRMYRGYPSGGYYGNYGRNYGPYQRSPYSSGYRGYSTPYGNNYYYRYGGRPYYYGGNSSWYGYRPGPQLQLGPNLGIYWY